MMLPIPGLAPFGPTIDGVRTRPIRALDAGTLRGLRGLGATTADFAQAIARMEGACSGSTCVNNNPGNLRSRGSYGPWPGQIGIDSRGLVIFDSAANGWAALDTQIRTNVNRGLTLDEFFGGNGSYPGYAPASDKNDPTGYAANVSAWTGLPRGVPLSQVLGVATGATASGGTAAPGETADGATASPEVFGYDYGDMTENPAAAAGQGLDTGTAVVIAGAAALLLVALTG